jgi:hypothetical protein
MTLPLARIIPCAGFSLVKRTGPPESSCAADAGSFGGQGIFICDLCIFRFGKEVLINEETRQMQFEIL